MYLLWKMSVLSTLDFMAIPGMLYFVINNYIPMLGIVIAFKKIDYRVGIMNSPWNGLDNFKQLFATSTGSFFGSDAWLITKNTMLYNLAFIVLGTVVGVLVGICLAELISKGLQKFFQTSILLPQLISYVIVAYIVYALLSNDAGLINHALGEGKSINFYAQPKWWPFILIFIYIWKMVGYNAIIFLSSIVGIDHSIYEAAKVDGATKMQQITKITLPLLKPTVITLFMLNIGRIMYSDFGLFYQVPMDSGALYSATNTIDTYVYRCLMTLNNISTSSAACTYQAIIGFILVLTVNAIVRRKDKENALF
ncbi:MAG: sugar ABC transporter permease [Blautia sp.]|nr:sugar ABC transporter permease [Blautia sp.]